MKFSKNEILSLDGFVDGITRLTPALCRAILRQESRSRGSDEVTTLELWAMEIIGEKKHCPQRELLQELRLKPSTGSLLLNRMEDQGLVRRARRGTDRRAVMLELTRKGWCAVTAARNRRKAALRWLFRPLDPRQRAPYLAVLKSLTEHLIQRSQP